MERGHTYERYKADPDDKECGLSGKNRAKCPGTGAVPHTQNK